MVCQGAGGKICWIMEPMHELSIMQSALSLALEQAKKALAFCVENLNAGDRFEVMRFSTEVDWRPGKLITPGNGRRIRTAFRTNYRDADVHCDIPFAVIGWEQSEKIRPVNSWLGLDSGATGVVGQQFVRRLAAHPWFRLRWLSASERSEGKRYRDVVSWRWPSQPQDRSYWLRKTASRQPIETLRGRGYRMARE